MKDLQVQTLTTKRLQIKSDLLSEKGMEAENGRSLKKIQTHFRGLRKKKRFQGLQSMILT